jgi:hypothetical protein
LTEIKFARASKPKRKKMYTKHPDEEEESLQTLADFKTIN